MKTHHLKDLLKKELLIIELPEETYYEVFKHGILFKDHLEAEREFIEGSYTLLGKPDEIKEDDAKELVNLHESGYYKDYINGNNFFTLPSKSFNSALESEIYWNVNPVKLFDMDNLLKAKHIAYNEIKKFNEAELRTFDRNRSIILFKN